jgi:hypothetical protein
MTSANNAHNVISGRVEARRPRHSYRPGLAQWVTTLSDPSSCPRWALRCV